MWVQVWYYTTKTRTVAVCASSSLDSSMRIWDLERGEKIANMDVGPVDMWTLAFSPDDKYIISGSHGGKITVYNVETAKAEQTLDTRGKFILSIAYVNRFLNTYSTLQLCF
jgi:WD repeat-containing protein 61